MIKKYGKKYGELAKIKESFYLENDSLLKERNAIRDIYNHQPLRTNCKLCNNKLGPSLFTSHGIQYTICPVCQHVNGIHDDTQQFSEIVYCEQDYAKSYSEKDRKAYMNRKTEIYLPKVQFLEEMIEEKLRILEIGAGSGYFSAAAYDRGYDVKGIEISRKQVEFANMMSGNDLLHCVPADEVVEYLKNAKRELVVAIGVLEHIYNMQEVLMAIHNNENIKYLYFSVPLFSLTVFFETVFQECFNRHLGGAHTHLFTMESIRFMNQKFNFKMIGQWTFGQDIADLCRFIRLRVEENNPGILEYFEGHFFECLDPLQKVIDEAEFASEVHIIAEVLH